MNDSIRKMLRNLKYNLLGLFSFRKAILFESVPDLSDNTKAVFDEMMRRGLDKRYDLVWMLHSEANPACKNPHIMFVSPNQKGCVGSFRILRLYARTVCMVSCNGFLIPAVASQKAFYLCHGSPVKHHRSYYTVPEEIQYCLVASENFSEVVSYELNYPASQIYALGFPRNDALTAKSKDIKYILKTMCEKVVVWYPTFRQHKYGNNTAAKNALPIIYDTCLAQKLNEAAKKANVLIVLKPHFAQDVTYIRDLELSNIRLINDDFFVKNDISSYEFLSGSDALITDYSSVYYDYTLVDKPIAVVWEDIEEYKKNPGFSLDIEQWMCGAEKIFTIDDFEEFICNVASGRDILQAERRKIRDLANYSTDGKNAQRVVDFIVEKAKL